MPVFTKKLKEKLKAQLLDQSRRIMAGTDMSGLGDILKKSFPSLSQPILIDCVPEQREDIYWLLLSLEEVAVVEIPRKPTGEEKVICKKMSIESYCQRYFLRDTRQKLEVALEIISER